MAATTETYLTFYSPSLPRPFVEFMTNSFMAHCSLVHYRHYGRYNKQFITAANYFNTLEPICIHWSDPITPPLTIISLRCICCCGLSCQIMEQINLFMTKNGAKACPPVGHSVIADQYKSHYHTIVYKSRVIIIIAVHIKCIEVIMQFSHIPFDIDFIGAQKTKAPFGISIRSPSRRWQTAFLWIMPQEVRAGL